MHRNTAHTECSPNTSKSHYIKGVGFHFACGATHSIARANIHFYYSSYIIYATRGFMKCSSIELTIA